jgi:hypothetical protein
VHDRNVGVPSFRFVRDHCTFIFINFGDHSRGGPNKGIDLDRNVPLDRPVNCMDVRSLGQSIGVGSSRIERRFKTREIHLKASVKEQGIIQTRWLERDNQGVTNSKGTTTPPLTERRAKARS